MGNENKTLKEKFLNVTGLTYDIDEVIKNLSEEDKEKFKKDILWHIPGGAYRKEGSERKKPVDEFISELETVLGEEKTPETPEESEKPKVEVNEETIAEGGELEVNEELETNAPIELKKDLDLTVSANITTQAGNDFIKVNGDAKLTVVGNGESVITSPLGSSDTGSSVFVAEENGTIELSNVNVIGARAVTVNGENANVTIESGEYDTFYGSAPSIYVAPNGGKITINGGTFGVKYKGNYYGGNKYLLNVYDALLKDTGKKPTDFIEVTGGRFIGFNPSNNTAEGANTSFVADGYIVKEEPEKIKGMIGEEPADLTVYVVEKEEK